MQFRQEARISVNPRKRVLRPREQDDVLLAAASLHTLHDQTTTRLRDLIVEGDIAEGQRLVESELCRRLRISRTPLREALKVLAGEGLVELQPNRGARVARMTAHEAAELFTVIAELEGLAATLCCHRIDAAELAQLGARHADMLACRAADNRHGYFLLNDGIHRAVVALSGNRVLAQTHQRLMSRARRARYQALQSFGRWDQSIAEHEALMQAFRDRNCSRAAHIWRDHVLATGTLVAARLARAEAEALEVAASA
jgi:DNA-binding GntR family transcriptional regulator